jgi:hypothetical protein
LRRQPLIFKSGPKLIQCFPHGAIDQADMDAAGSIDLEAVDWSPDVAGAGMGRVRLGNALGDLQLVLSSSNAAICTRSNLDSDVTRRLGLLFASAHA